MKTVLRYIPRKYLRLLFWLVICTTSTFMLVEVSYEIRKHRNFNPGSFITQVHDPFGSRNVRQCAALEYTAVKQSTVTRVSKPQGTYTKDQSFCYISEGNNADIQMEDIWDTVSMGYPRLVLTVTGWVDMIKVEGWSVKPLTVIVMPHSHQDPGWLATVDSYFISSARPTLNLMVEKLKENPSWTFIWAEVVYLQRWWSEATKLQQEQFKRLLKNGQLELVSGGWVMTDESVSHYAAMVDQLTEGHLWIKNNLNVTVENSWAIDPFGHSSTMANILRQSGIRNMVIQRTHFAIKKMFAKQKNLEFYWRQTWDDKGTTDIFCHMMPFMLYGIPFSCGPDRHVCCKFDFHKQHCFYGKQRVELTHVTDENVAGLARELWEQLQKKSELFQSNVLLMPHGDDFRYQSNHEWKVQFENLQKLMNYINRHPEMKTKIEFGTLKDFFKNVRNKSPAPRTSYPVLSGDFFPYSDRGDQYWSGFYTSRPHFKYIIRQLQHLLRSTELLFTLAMTSVDFNTSIAALYEKLEAARRAHALSQHHDAITGTSRKFVMRDYKNRVLSAINNCTEVQRQAVSTILKLNKRKNILVNLTESYIGSNSFASKLVCRLDTPVNVIVWNDIGQPRNDLVHLLVEKPDVEVIDSFGRPIRHQISPVWENQNVKAEHYLLTIEVNVDAFSLSTFKISAVPVSPESTFASILNFPDTNISPSKPGRFNVRDVSDTYYSVSNSYITATFKACDGMLNSMFYKELESSFKVDTHFVTYGTGRNTHPFQDKSGAYTFVPDGVAENVDEKPRVIVVEGSLFTEVQAIYMDFKHTSRIYNITGFLAETIHIENYVGIDSKNWDNRELVMRIETSVANGNIFYTDTNGYQLHRRKTRSKMSIQGNFYPLTSMAMLEDEATRFTLMSSQSHGVASLVSGWLEVVLDRHLIQDDWRGLNEGVIGNERTKSSFCLLFEKKSFRKKEHRRRNKYIGFPTLRSDYLTAALNSPLKIYSLKSSDMLLKKDHGIKLATRLPCGFHIVNLRMLHAKNQVKEALMTVHRIGLECSYSSIYNTCSERDTLQWSEVLLGLQKVIQTSITGSKSIRDYQVTDSIDVEPMQIKTFQLTFR